MSWLEKLLPPKIKRSDSNGRGKSSIPEGLWSKCGVCEAVLYRSDLDSNQGVCPKCGHQQDKAAECAACGIIIDKYLARQAQQAESAPASATLGAQSPYSPPRSEVGDSLPEYGALKVFTTDGRIGRVRYLG